MNDTDRDKLTRIVRQSNSVWERLAIFLLALAMFLLCIASLTYILSPPFVKSLIRESDEVKSVTVSAINALMQDNIDSLDKVSYDKKTAINLIDAWRHIRRTSGVIKDYRIIETRFTPEWTIGAPASSSGVAYVAETEIEFNFDSGKVILELEMKRTEKGYKIKSFKMK